MTWIVELQLEMLHEGLSVNACLDRACQAQYWLQLLLEGIASALCAMGDDELAFGTERIVVSWYELVATPHWTTVLVYPEDDVLRLWLLANPAEIGDQGADEILHMLVKRVDELVLAINDDGVWGVYMYFSQSMSCLESFRWQALATFGL